VSISIGQRQDIFKPLDQDGNFTRDALGCHRGHMEVLNVRNPRPGFRYYYPRTDPSSMRRALRRGWQPCKLTDPERLGEEESPDLVGTGLDTSLQRQDIILCRMPEERYRAQRAEIDALSERMQGDESAAEFLEKGRAFEGAYGQVYFKDRSHGFRHSEH